MGQKQVSNPGGGYEVNQKSVSSGDHSFTAKSDGTYTYCFSNKHWGASSKEVFFNVHGIVYVSESDMPSDPIETEGMTRAPLSRDVARRADACSPASSPPHVGAPRPGQGRATVHHCA